MRKASCKVSEALAARLAAAARMRGVTRSQLTREALEEKLARLESEMPPSLLDLAWDFCGIVDSGIPDLGSNPRYLDDFGK